MRYFGNTIAPLLVVTLASVAYARVPARDAASTLINGTATAAQQDDAKPQQDDTKPKKDDAKPAKSHKMPAKQQTEDKDKDQRRDNDQAKDQRDKQAGQHGRIKDEDYRTHFGQTHRFTVRTVVTTTRVIPHQTRFAYSGYNFVFVDPWPAEWALTDDCYIDYIDGAYFIINPMHPGARVALMIAD